MILNNSVQLNVSVNLQAKGCLFSNENADVYDPMTNNDSFNFFFMFCVLAALPTLPADFFDNNSADCCVEVQVSFNGATEADVFQNVAKSTDDVIAAINAAYATAVGRLPYFPEYED